MTTLTMKDEKRLKVIQRVFQGEMTVVQAALVLGIGERQCYRIKARVKKGGCRVPPDSEHGVSESKMAIERRGSLPGGRDGQTESMERREALSDRQRSAESKRAGGADRQAAPGLRRVDLPVARQVF